MSDFENAARIVINSNLSESLSQWIGNCGCRGLRHHTLVLDNDLPGHFYVSLFAVGFAEINFGALLKFSQNLFFEIGAIEPSVVAYLLNFEVEAGVDYAVGERLALVEFLNSSDPLQMLIALG